MAGQKVDVGADGFVAEEAGRGIGYAMGTTKPADGAKGYAPYCVFAASSGLFVNVGSKDSANFDGIGDVDGSLLADTISEFTSDTGVTVDGLLLKDGGIDLNGTGELLIDASGTTKISTAGDEILFTHLDVAVAKTGDDGFRTDVLGELTADHGVEIDAVSIKDGGVTVTATGSFAGAGSTIAGLMPAAAQQALAAAGAVNVTTFYTSIVSDGDAEAYTLADGAQIGQLKKVKFITDGGGDAVLTPTNLAGGTTITFADAGDYCLLMWNGTDWVAVELGNDADGATAPVLA